MPRPLVASVLAILSIAPAQTSRALVSPDRVHLTVEAPVGVMAWGLLSLSPATIPTPLGPVLAEPAVVPFPVVAPGAFEHTFPTALLRRARGPLHWQAAVLTATGFQLLPVASLAAPRWRIVVMAGQSNMEGEASLPLPEGVRAENAALPVWDRITGITGRWAPLVAGANNNGALRSAAGGVRKVQGPEMAFAERCAQLAAQEPGETAVLVKAAQSGSSLFPQARDWTWDPATPGNLWDDLGGAALPGRGCLRQDLRDAIASLGGPDAVARIDFLWYQGESDAMIEVAALQYQARLAAFLHAVRADFAFAPVTFHVVQLHAGLVRGSGPTALDGFWFCDAVRAAQAAVAAQEADVRLIQVDDVALAADRTHYAADGYRRLGDRLFASWRDAVQPR
jgi:hypothetical protein